MVAHFIAWAMVAKDFSSQPDSKLFHLVFSIWKFISRSLTTTRLERSVSFLFNRTILMKQRINRARTMVNEAPHPTIRPYVQYHRVSMALFSRVSGFIGHLWYGRFSYCFIDNIGDGLIGLSKLWL